MLNILPKLYQILKNYAKQLHIKHTNSLMSAYLQLELPFIMASETTHLPLRLAQLQRAARTRRSIKGN